MSKAAEEITEATLKKLLQLVKFHTGITMEERKRELLFGRIRPRMRALGLQTPEQYIQHLEQNHSEAQEFVNKVTTNETLFFRTPLIWDYFQKEFLGQWWRQNQNETLRIWSAASSSGEEACSIAISCEEFKLHHPSFRYKIFASDISTDVLNLAKSGLFKIKSSEDLKKRHPEIFQKYLAEQETGGARLNTLVLQNIEFFIHNLHHQPSKQQFYDLVFLRNVLIYFNDVDQEFVLKNIYSSIKNSGMLILGESESLARLKTPFLFKKPLIYQRVA